MDSTNNDFGKFEHAGWQRVAGTFEDTWGSLTTLFIPALLDAAGVRPGVQLLDVACGPGFVAEAAAARGAAASGVDFSENMITIARQRLPGIEFRVGDAQALDHADEQFDILAMNFGVLHIPDPPKAFAEAARVLKAGGRYAFSSWAKPEVSLGARIVEEAIEAHADANLELPEGPDFFTYTDPDATREILVASGFDGASMQFATVTVKWQVPKASHLFELERDHGVRTAAVLAAQSQERLAAIQAQIETEVHKYANQEGFALPYAAHIITADKA